MNSPQQVKRSGNIYYLVLLFLIGLISVYDTILSVMYHEVMIGVHGTEENFVWVWVLDIGGMPLFVFIKSSCTLLAICICIPIVKTKYRVAILGVFLFQVWLFCYLTFSGRHSFEGPHPIVDSIKFYIYGLSK